jgi:hypothetical protein
MYRDIKCGKKIIPVVKDSWCKGTEAWVLSQGRLATKLYPYATETKIKTTVTIGGHIPWMCRGLSLK